MMSAASQDDPPLEPPAGLPSSEYLADQDGERFDVFLARRLPGLSRSQARRLIDDGLARVDGDLERPAYRLQFGAMVSVRASADPAPVAEAQEIPLDVRYEDADLIVLNKQVGLTVHPAPGQQSGTLVNALLHHCPDLRAIGDTVRPGLVHRLDKDTSGVMVVAKSPAAMAGLQDQMRARTIEKRYWAVAVGVPDPPSGVIDGPIGRDPADRRKMAVVERGRPSRTEYWVRERYLDTSLVECRLITGRTHQIRVHLMALGHPIVGDLLYGSASPHIDRQALHAWKLAFDHPTSGERLAFEVEPPADFDALLGTFRAAAVARGLDVGDVDTVAPESAPAAWRPSRHRARHIR